jgi:D-alanyl-D-alanine carboxypeptidase/D-alanyl-D-alanine-endopeptidase (penicillin-binding protein 4)
LSRSASRFAVIALLLPLFAPGSRADSLEMIQDRIAKALKRPGVRSAYWGIEVVDPASNRVLLSVNPDKPFQPASVLKVVTTAAAIEKLGPDFRFRTGVYTDGTLRPDGVLEGDLILVGRGDPNLIDPVGDLLEKPTLRELAESLQAAGLRRVGGRVVGDDSYFDYAMYGRGWTARDLRTVSGAPVGALCISDNVFTLHARATKLNHLIAVSLDPPASYFHIRNLGLTGRAQSRRTIAARLIPGTHTITVSGILPAGQSHFQTIVIDRPAEVTASIFKDELKRLGIEVAGKTGVLHDGDMPREMKRGWTLLAEHRSPPLIRALEIINKRSQNLHAEMLLRTLGAEFGAVGSDEAGIEVVKQFLVEAGIETDRVRLNDGCGLSRDNILTPHFQTSLLTFLWNRPYFNLFVNTLAVSGTDGTLKNRMNAETVRGAVHAKTGSLAGVTALSGYMTTRSGRNLVFTIFANNVSYAMTRVKKTIDEICALFVNLY